MSGFRFRTNGVRVDNDLFDALRRARGTHGDIKFVDVKSANTFEVTTSEGTRTLSGTVRLSNMLNQAIAEEPARRAAYKASVSLPPPPNGDERFAASEATEEDAAHHRGFRFETAEA